MGYSHGLPQPEWDAGKEAIGELHLDVGKIERKPAEWESRMKTDTNVRFRTFNVGRLVHG